MAAQSADALVIFGATGDLAKLETFPALVGLAERGVLDFPVEDVLFGRFANAVVEPLLNRTYVESIQITMAEAFDVSDRGSFYDRTGAIRDVVQNHMLQVLATVMADPPEGQGLSNWRDSKARLVASLAPLSPEHTVRGQYEGYHDVQGVDPRSTVDT